MKMVGYNPILKRVFLFPEMSIELNEAKEKVAIFQKECDDYLIILVEQKREADEQTKVRLSFLHFGSCLAALSLLHFFL